jgi:hypothetical protein
MKRIRPRMKFRDGGIEEGVGMQIVRYLAMEQQENLWYSPSIIDTWKLVQVARTVKGRYSIFSILSAGEQILRKLFTTESIYTLVVVGIASPKR